MKDTYSAEIAAAIKAFLEEDDWRYYFDEKRGTFRFGLNLQCRLQKIDYLIHVSERSFNVYAVSPIGANHQDTDMISEMNDFINRANYGLTNGNFEFDCRDGEIRYKVYTDCTGTVPGAEAIRKSILLPSSMFRKYAPGILGILFKGENAEEAIEQCEGSIQSIIRNMLGDESVDSDLRDRLLQLTESLEDSDDEGDETEDASASEGSEDSNNPFDDFFSPENDDNDEEVTD